MENEVLSVVGLTVQYVSYFLVITGFLVVISGVFSIVRDIFWVGGDKVIGKGVKRGKSNFTYCP